MLELHPLRTCSQVRAGRSAWRDGKAAHDDARDRPGRRARYAPRGWLAAALLVTLSACVLAIVGATIPTRTVGTGRAEPLHRRARAAAVTGQRIGGAARERAPRARRPR